MPVFPATYLDKVTHQVLRAAGTPDAEARIVAEGLV